MRSKVSIALLILIAITLAVLGYNRHSAIQTAIAWARVAPLPVTSICVDVETSGSMFTREITLSFTPTESQLFNWLIDSDGISDAERISSGDVTRYLVLPGEGAQFAEVSIDEAIGLVTIRAYWS